MENLVDGARRRRFTAPTAFLVALACGAAALALTPSAADEDRWHVTTKTGDADAGAGTGGTGSVLAVRRSASGAVPRESGPIGITGDDVDQVTLALFSDRDDLGLSDDGIVLVDFDGRVLGTGPGVAWYPHHPEDGVELRADELGIATLTQAQVVTGSRDSALPAEPVAAVGHWAFALPSPDGRWILAQWAAECEVPIAYLLEVRTGRAEPVFDKGSFSHAIGWTPDGHAVVGAERAECGSTVPKPGTYLVNPTTRSRHHLHPYGRGALVVGATNSCCQG